MKRKLFLLLCTVLTMLGAQAQKDVTSTYITNATLSSLDGWTNVNFNTPVQGNNTTGYASECYAGWGSLEKDKYSLTQKITLPAGNYTLVNYSFFRYGLAYNTDASKSLAYLKAGDSQVAVKTLGSISASGYADSQAEGANAFDSKMYRNTLDFTIDADNTEIEIGLVGTFDLKQSWMICGMFELIYNDEEATMDSPFDVTGYLTNPGFEYRDMTGWTLSESGAFGAQSNTSFDNKAGGYYAEKWQASGALSDRSMSQTLSDLPAGLYTLSAYAYYDSDGAYISLSDGTDTKTTSVTSGSSSKYSVSFVLAEGKDLTVAAGIASGTRNWICFDRFSLSFGGDVNAALTTLLNKVSDYDGVIPTAAYSDLQTNVAAYDQTYTDVDELLDAIDAVQALYDAADLLKTPYATITANLAAAQTLAADYSNVLTMISTVSAGVESSTEASTIESYNTQLTTVMSAFEDYLDVKNSAETLAAVESTDTEAQATLSSAISTQDAAVQAATTPDALNTAMETATTEIKSAAYTYISAADPTEGNRFDLTFLMTNPDLTGLATWQPADGWASEESDGNSQVMVNASKTVTVDGVTYSYFYEYWSETAKASGNFALYNAVTLPEGTYSMSCYAFAEDQYTSSTVNGVFFYANDTQGSAVTSTQLSEQSISFINDAEQEVKIGLKTLATGNTRNWMGIGYVKLYKEYTDNTTYPINVNATGAEVVATVDGVVATEALALKNVTLTVSMEDGYTLSELTATYNDGTDDVSLDVANPSEGVYTFQMPAYEVNVTLSTSVDKSALSTAIAAATAARKSSNEGEGIFQIPASAGTALAAAIEEAEAVYNSSDATVSEVAAAATAIAAAQATYEATELNAPDADTYYNITVATEGHAKEGNAIIIKFDATSNTNPTGYVMNCNNAVNANYAQSVAFAQVSGNTYNISFLTTEGVTYLTYGTLNGSTATWSDYQIQATTEADDKGEFLIQATETAGVFNIINTITNTSVDCQSGGNIYTEGGNTGFAIAEASQATAPMTITDAGWATFIAPFAVAVPEGVTAYIVTGVNDENLTITEVSAIPANFPVLLNGNAYSDTKSGWGLASADTYTVNNLLTGVYTTQTVPGGCYGLQKDSEGKAVFNKVSDENTEGVQVGANRAYLTYDESNARTLYINNGDDTTGINSLDATTALEDLLSGADIYDLNGRKVNGSLQKGKVYIVNGKKLYVK